MVELYICHCINHFLTDHASSLKLHECEYELVQVQEDDDD